MLDEGFQVRPFDFLDCALTGLPIKVQEEPVGVKGTRQGTAFVVQAPLVAHVALQVLLGGKLQGREPLKDPVDGSG